MGDREYKDWRSEITEQWCKSWGGGTGTETYSGQSAKASLRRCRLRLNSEKEPATQRTGRKLLQGEARACVKARKKLARSRN